MRWEALLWSLLAIIAPAVAGKIWRRLDPALPDWLDPLIDGAGWLHGLMLPYAALLLGSIPGGLLGLYAITLFGWIAGGLACSLGLIAVVLVYKLRPKATLQPRRALERWKDEPRWAMYRATGAIWLQDLALGAGLGFVLSIAEWVVSSMARKTRDFTRQDREPLYRSGISTILFLVTQNFWITAGTQLVFFVLLEMWANRQPENVSEAKSRA